MKLHTLKNKSTRQIAPLVKNKMRKKKENRPKIIEELIPMTEEQLEESIKRLTQIYAQVLGWEPKSTRTQSIKQKRPWI